MLTEPWLCNMSKKRGMATDSLAIGVDLGGTHVLAILMDQSGCVHTRHKLTLSEADRGSREIIGEALGRCVVEVWRYARAHHSRSLPVRGVGIAVPGNVDPVHGTARYLPNFGWLEPVDLADLVLKRTVSGEVPSVTIGDALQLNRLHMRNDGRCAALAERHFGIGADGAHSVMAMLTLGTGIGGALIHDAGTDSERGVLFDGCSFDAGDFGHHVLRSYAPIHPSMRAAACAHHSLKGSLRTNLSSLPTVPASRCGRDTSSRALAYVLRMFAPMVGQRARRVCVRLR